MRAVRMAPLVIGVLRILVRLVCALALPCAAAAADQPAHANVRARIVSVAERQLGYHDHGDYCTKYGPCEYWCSLFSTWVWERAGVAIPRYGFTGTVWKWARQDTYVLRRSQRPRPGDAVLFGTGPSDVDSSLHIGIVEDVYPGYLVTIEGDTAHAVRRFVVSVAHPRRDGEPGGIYAYASPTQAAGRAAAARGLSPPHGPTGRRLRLAVAAQDQPRRLSPLSRAIQRLRAFQHMPWQSGSDQITWYYVDSRGRILVRVSSTLSLADAEATWRAFLARYHDRGAAYAVQYVAPPPSPSSPPSSTTPPSAGGALSSLAK